MKTFSNRDTLVDVPEGTVALDFAGARPDRRFVHVTESSVGGAALDETTAAAVCNANPTNCRVLRLAGAARQSVGEPIAILEVAPANTTTADIDDRLQDLREQLDTQSIHVLNAADYGLLPTARPVIYARGFATLEEAAELCERAEPLVGECTTQTLEPAD
jgi:hypothetical protein